MQIQSLIYPLQPQSDSGRSLDRRTDNSGEALPVSDVSPDFTYSPGTTLERVDLRPLSGQQLSYAQYQAVSSYQQIEVLGNEVNSTGLINQAV